jgi:phage-related protein
MAYRVLLYRSSGGDSPASDFLGALPDKDQAKVAAAMDYLGQQVRRFGAPHAAHVRGKLWELRVSLGRSEYRLLYFFLEGQIVVVAHGFMKMTQAIPAREIDTAEKRMKDDEARVRRGEVTW